VEKKEDKSSLLQRVDRGEAAKLNTENTEIQRINFCHYSGSNRKARPCSAKLLIFNWRN